MFTCIPTSAQLQDALNSTVYLYPLPTASVSAISILVSPRLSTLVKNHCKAGLIKVLRCWFYSCIGETE